MYRYNFDTNRSCCGGTSTLPIANFTSASGCSYTYCNVTSQAVADAFVSCLATSAPGIRGKCFESDGVASLGVRSKRNGWAALFVVGLVLVGGLV